MYMVGFLPQPPPTTSRRSDFGNLVVRAKSEENENLTFFYRRWRTFIWLRPCYKNKRKLICYYYMLNINRSAIEKKEREIRLCFKTLKTGLWVVLNHGWIVSPFLRTFTVKVELKCFDRKIYWLLAARICESLNTRTENVHNLFCNLFS